MDTTQPSNQITTGKVAKYMLLPGIFPRLRRLAGVVGHFLHIFTVTFGVAGLIPRGHPCLLTENIGKYRFRDIIGLAASNVAFSKENIPQILMFFAVILGFLISLLMVGTMVFQLGLGATAAQAQYFSNPVGPANQDVAYQFLYQVFGDTGLDIWGGGVLPDGVNSVNIMTDVLMNMLSLYSQAMLVIAGFIVIYLLIMTVAESAQTGQPFGKRFDSLWAPIRLAVAIGLLIPLGGGYNSAQLIVFQASHWGSNLASNVWASGLEAYRSEEFFAAMQPDSGYQFTRGMFLIAACEGAWNEASTMAGTSEFIELNTTTNSEYTLYQWGVGDDKDFCGSLKVAEVDTPFTVPVYESAGPGLPATLNPMTINTFPIQAQIAYANYYSTVFPVYQNEGATAAQAVLNDMDIDVSDLLTTAIQSAPINAYRQALGYADGAFYATGAWPGYVAELNTAANGIVAGGSRKGWAGAGGFYLTLTKINEVFSSAASSKPQIVSMPALLNNAEANPYFDKESKGSWFFNMGGVTESEIAEISGASSLFLQQADEFFINKIAESDVLSVEFDYAGQWKQELESATQKANKGDNTQADASGRFNFIGDIIFKAFQVEGLNPLGKLMAIGNGLLYSAAGSYAAGVMFTLDIIIFGFKTPTSQVLGDMFFNLANILLLAGFALTIGVPAFPFLFFTFAVIEWVASVFEAVIGMPLWALSFLTIDGDGFFGSKAAEGAWLIFEIFLRPTIIILSLIGSALMFVGAMNLVNATFVEFIGSAQNRNALPFSPFQFLAYVMMYVFIAYSVANSCFKFIDEMPNQFMRWIKSVASFGASASAGVSDVNPYIAGKQFQNLAGSGKAGIDRQRMEGGKGSKGNEMKLGKNLKQSKQATKPSSD